jgi:ABC-type uncharacterized transport system involved in gliding motility auxiliary subunit
MAKHSWLLAVLGLLCMLFHLVARVSWGQWGGWPAGVGAAGLLLWLAWIWIDQAPLRRAAQSRAVRYHVVASALVLSSLVLAIGLNVLAHRYDQRWDLTSTGRHTLSPQTVKILEGLEDEVSVVAFFPTASPDERSFLDLFDAYQQHSTKLQLQLHDPLRDLNAARQHEVTNTYGTVVLRAGDDQQRLESSFDEQSLSNALIRLVSGVEHSVCFLGDHGEASPDSDEGDGMSGAVMKLEGQNYQVDRVSILQHGGVPAHCEVLVVAAPTVEPLPEEREAIAAHLLAGRAAMILLEPLATPSFAQDLRRYGLSLAPDVVLREDPELQDLGFDASHLHLGPDQFDYHPITNELDSLVTLQLARSVEKVEDIPAGLQVQILARTPAGAWGETSLDDDAILAPTPALDRIGIIGLAAAVEIIDPAAVPTSGHDLAPAEPPLAPTIPALEPEAEPASPPGEPTGPRDGSAGGRLVFFGDASFTSNQHLLEGLNQDLFLNSVAWLVDEEDQLSIRPNEATSGLLDYSLLQALIMWFVALFGVPGMAVVAALFTWFRRRRM